jgi:ParB family chromosome partitioning protein
VSKADKLGKSAAFGSVGRPSSARRQLIAQATGEAPADPARVPLDQLAGNPDNPREAMGDLEELANSLREHGLRQPVTVMPRAAFLEVYPQHEAAIGQAAFVVVNGNRRLAAARIAGLPTLAVYIAEGPATDLASVRTAVLVENIHRLDLAPLEEAKALAELMEIHRSQVAVAAEVGKTQGWVSQRLALLSLAPDLRDDLREGRLKVKEARAMAKLSEQEQLAARQRDYYPVIPPKEPTGPESSAAPTPPPAPPGFTASSPAPEGAPRRGPAKADHPSDGGPAAAPAPSPQQLVLDLEWRGEAKGLAKQIYSFLQEKLGGEDLDAVLEELEGFR